MTRPPRIRSMPVGGEDDWDDIGRGRDLEIRCIHHGWTLDDVCAVLGTDQPTPIPAECLYLESDPLEVLGDLRASTSAPSGQPSTELLREPR